ncbi:cyclic nucleotide-binding domain-containing protein [Spirochaeta africana]|uniref:Cyclic nucleotide-binding protein n=1 Tax=Spirochaeta africana (strain ATCC 700263 / DSM 8902 / Z-7692) TaxID=889378 RepID=H9UIP4_SPIAZ|nr:cyclic nucleotide-binding domain-containing protein [Spirochaeta africana]AFG37387.1 cyclic nucleotide-binding protein [Spirochaeta africana DSM 8902]
MKAINEASRRQTLVEGLGSIFLFRYLSDTARRNLGEFVEFFDVAPGETIVQEGEKTPYLYTVIDGSVNVVTGDDSKEVYLCCLGSGEVFGEAGVFLKMRRTASVRAADNAVIMRLQRDQFVQFVRKQPRAANTILLVMVHSLLRKLRDTNQELAFERKLDSDQGDIDAMIAGFLQNGDE